MKRVQTSKVRTSTGSNRGPGRPRKHSDEEPPERIAAYLPRELATSLRVFAVTQRPRRSVSDVVVEAVREYLERTESR